MKLCRLSLLLMFGLSIAAGANGQTKAPPDITVDGMQRVKNTELALVYAKPGVDLSRYNRLLVIEPKVSFVSRWLQNQNAIPNQRVRKEDMERIRTELGELFMEVFEQELQNKTRNEAAARDMLGQWAAQLRMPLDEARSVISQQ